MVEHDESGIDGLVAVLSGNDSPRVPPQPSGAFEKGDVMGLGEQVRGAHAADAGPYDGDLLRGGGCVFKRHSVVVPDLAPDLAIVCKELRHGSENGSQI